MVINKDKIGLADQSLPNAKCMLFGEVLNLITSKRANLSKEVRHIWRQLVPLTGTSLTAMTTKNIKV